MRSADSPGRGLLPVRMRRRLLLFVLTFVAFPMAGAALGLLETRVGVPLLLTWFLVFALAQLVIFRCPHCKNVAILTPGGLASPFVGTRCRYCGREY